MSRPRPPAQLLYATLSILGGVVVLQGVLLRLGWPGVFPGLLLVACACWIAAAAQPGWDKLHRTPRPARAPQAPTAPPTPPAAPGHPTPHAPYASPAAHAPSAHPRRTRWRHRLALVGLAVLCTAAAAALAYLAWTQLRIGGDRLFFAGPPPLPGTPDRTALIRTVLLSATAAFILYFLRHALAPLAAAAPRRRDPRGVLTALMLLLAAQAVAGGLRLYSPAWDFGRALSTLTTWLALLLTLEWALAAGLRALQPPAQRRVHAFSGYSFTLSLLGGKSPGEALALAFHEGFGLELRGSWLARYARLSIEPLLLLLLLTGWLSTAVVLIPADSQGVRVTWGRFQPIPLGPGLHLIAPWPMEHVRLVPAQRVQEFALGFDQDLGGPVLWTEVHFSGESNLLVGNGEEVLTFNVPVLYDLADALAAERTSAAPGRLLANLAQRELLLATATRASFGIMTTERGAISTQLGTQLQLAADRLHLGARIRHVGLKDIHPPVEVAPAYQEVISAREQRRMMIDLAAANRITALAEARTEDFRARRQAESFAAERVAAVAGEAFILTGKVEARQADPALFDFRSRLLVAEEVMPNLRLILTDTSRLDEGTTTTLDLREGGTPYP